MSVGSTLGLLIAQVFGCSAAFALKRFRSVGSIWVIPHDPAYPFGQETDQPRAAPRKSEGRAEEERPYHHWRAGCLKPPGTAGAVPMESLKRQA
jgi:hypothetical protein